MPKRGNKSVRFADQEQPRPAPPKETRFVLTERLNRLEQELNEKSKLLDTLKMLPQKLGYETVVPVGRFAFTPAKLERTNEVLVDLGGGFYTWQSCYQAQVILCRRLNALVETIDATKVKLIEAGQNEEEIDEQTNLPSAQEVERSFHLESGSGQPPEFRLSWEEAEALRASVPAPKPKPREKVTDEQHAEILAKLGELAEMEQVYQARQKEAQTDEDQVEFGEEFAEPTEPLSDAEIRKRLDKLERMEAEAERARRDEETIAKAARDDAKDRAPPAPNGGAGAVMGKVVERAAPSLEKEKSVGQPPQQQQQQLGTRKASLFKQKRQQAAAAAKADSSHDGGGTE